MRMFKISRGTQDCWGIAINYNPDYRDVSFHFLKWYIAIGLKKKTISWDDIRPELLEEWDWDEEDLYYAMADDSFCEMCDDFLVADDIILALFAEHEDDDYILVCEYCLNPDLKGE